MMEIRVFDGQFFIDGFPVRRGFKLQGEKKILSYISRTGACASPIEERGGDLLFEEGAFRAIYWKQGVELRPPFRLAPPPKRIALTCYGQPLSLEITEGESGSISIEGNSTSIFFPKYAITNARAEILSGQSTAVLDLRAKAREGEYVALFSLTSEGAKLLLEGCGEIRTSGNDVLLKEPLGGARERVRTSRWFWQGASFALTSRSFERGASPAFTEREGGRLLLEAVAAEDDEDILSYLAPEIADAGEIKRYFGAIGEIRSPLFPSSETAIAVQKRRGGKTFALTYDFTFEGGKIANILGED